MNKETTNVLQNLPLMVGVDLGGTQLRVAVLRGAQLLSRVSLLTGANPTPHRIIPCVYQAIDQVLDDAGIELNQIRGIGIGVAGPLDSRTGIVFASPNLPGWDHVPLREIFYEHFNIPIFVENDANAATFGEHMFGAGRGCKNMIYLTISTGIGGGVLLNGQLLRGRNGTAGELGHITVDWHGKRCNCGNVGCLESIASGMAIARRAQEAIGMERGKELLAFACALQQDTTQASQLDPSVDNYPNYKHFACERDAAVPFISAHTVSLAAQAGIPLACSLIRDAAEALGVGLVNIIHIFNPEMIILGGSVMQSGALLMEPALQIVRERAMQVPYEAVSIVQAQLNANEGLVGAGTLIYQSIGPGELW